MNNGKNNAHCSNCGYFVFKPDETWWDESGYSYSTKLVRCPDCGKIVVVGYKEDYGFDVNNDSRYYF